jgi:hypothetical protein
MSGGSLAKTATAVKTVLDRRECEKGLPDFEADQHHADDKPREQTDGNEIFKADRHVDASGQRPGCQVKGVRVVGAMARAAPVFSSARTTPCTSTSRRT